MTNSNARDKFLALIRQNGWVNDPTAKISQGRYREEEWVQDPYTFVRLAADGVGKWRIRLDYKEIFEMSTTTKLKLSTYRNKHGHTFMKWTRDKYGDHHATAENGTSW